MHKILFSALACAAVAATSTAQLVIDPCGPAVFGTPLGNADLGNLNLNVTEVGQVCLIPNPAGPGYLGHATVKKIGATDWDAMSFTWAGPGSAPTVTTDCDGLNGTADEYQVSLSWDGLATVLDCGTGNPNSGGANRPILATRATPSGPFTVVGLLGGSFPATAGYYDPQLGHFDIDRDGTLDDVVYWAAASGGISAGKLNRATGAVTNVITAIAPQTQVPGFQFCHSPTPQNDSIGITRGLYFSVYALNTGSDAHYFPGEAMAHYLTAPTAAYALFDDGTSWDANPGILKGNAYYARAVAGYGDPLLIENFTLSNCSIAAATGGSVAHFGFFPLSLSGATMFCAVNYGFAMLPTPLPPSFAGLVGWGNLCVAPSFSLGVTPANSEFGLGYSLPAGLPTGTLLAEAVALNIATSEVFISNVAILELR